MESNIFMKRLFLLIPVLFIFLFLVLPVGSIILEAFKTDQNFLISAVEVISDNQKLIFNSVYQAFFSTVAAVGIGLVAAFVFSKYDFRGKKFFSALSLVPFVMPSILVALAFVLVFGNNGVLNRVLMDWFLLEEPIKILYSFNGIILAHAFYNFPIVMRFVSATWSNLDKKMQFAAETLGAGKWTVFWKITLPQLLPSIFAAASLVFVYCFMSFAIVLTLGGVEFSTLEIGIFQAISRDFDLFAGMILAGIQFVILFGVLMFYQQILKKYNVKTDKINTQKEKISFKSWKGLGLLSVIGIIVGIILIPLLAIVLFSVSNGGVSNYVSLFSGNSVTGSSAFNAILTSLGFGFGTVLVTVPVSLMFAIYLRNKKSFLRNILVMSIAVSSVTLGLGYVLFFSAGSWIIIVLAHSVLAMPFAFRIISNSLEKIPDETLYAAESLGASFSEKIKRVIIPIIKPGIIGAAAFSFAISLGELALTFMLYNGKWVTIPLYIYRLISSFRLFEATAMGVILILLSALSFYLIETYSKQSVIV